MDWFRRYFVLFESVYIDDCAVFFSPSQQSWLCEILLYPVVADAAHAMFLGRVVFCVYASAKTEALLAKGGAIAVFRIHHVCGNELPWRLAGWMDEWRAEGFSKVREAAAINCWARP